VLSFASRPVLGAIWQELRRYSRKAAERVTGTAHVRPSGSALTGEGVAPIRGGFAGLVGVRDPSRFWLSFS